MMHELMAFFAARLDEDEQLAASGESWTAFDEAQGTRRVDVDNSIERVVACTRSWRGLHIAHHDPARVLRDIAADRKLIARYKAAVESHEEALQEFRDLRKAGAEPGELQVAGEDLAAAHASVSAYLTVLEDRAARFFDHDDYQPHWRQP